MGESRFGSTRHGSATGISDLGVSSLHVTPSALEYMGGVEFFRDEVHQVRASDGLWSDLDIFFLVVLKTGLAYYLCVGSNFSFQLIMILL